jgi:acetyl-CoA carboxylase alpha subunit
MTGPEHYREAERLAGMAHRFTYGDGADPTVGAALAAEAQVHATLALAAVTALTAPVCTDTEDGSGHATKADYDAWVAVAGGGA